jgi:hypothetical protein
MKEIKIEIPAGCEVERIETLDGAVVVTFKEKEPQLPKSWEEFCKMFPIKEGEFRITTSSVLLKAKDNPQFDEGEKVRFFSDANILPDRATAEAVLALCQLIQLRECYNGDWVPDYKTADTKFSIEFDNNKIVKNTTKGWPCILIFKSEELRDAFLRNFRPLIEKLKPLYGIKEGGEE